MKITSHKQHEQAVIKWIEMACKNETSSHNLSGQINLLLPDKRAIVFPVLYAISERDGDTE